VTILGEFSGRRSALCVAVTSSTIPFSSLGPQSGQVDTQNRLGWLRDIPFWMLEGAESPYAVTYECELKIHRLLGPKCAVIIEGGDTRSSRAQSEPWFCRAAEIRDRLLGRAIVPTVADHRKLSQVCAIAATEGTDWKFDDSLFYHSPGLAGFRTAAQGRAGSLVLSRNCRSW
jgi:hypothetical protein